MPWPNAKQHSNNTQSALETIIQQLAELTQHNCKHQHTQQYQSNHQDYQEENTCSWLAADDSMAGHNDANRVGCQLLEKHSGDSTGIPVQNQQTILPNPNQFSQLNKQITGNPTPKTNPITTLLSLATQPQPQIL